MSFLMWSEKRHAVRVQTGGAGVEKAVRQRGACIVVLLSVGVLALLGLSGLVDLASHLLKIR